MSTEDTEHKRKVFYDEYVHEPDYSTLYDNEDSPEKVTHDLGFNLRFSNQKDVIDHKIREGEGNGHNNSKKKQNSKREDKEDEEKLKKREQIIFKYSNYGKGELHESVIINGYPYFLKYNFESKKFEIIDKIEETNRILIPPKKESMPYIQYEFSSMDEVNNIGQLIKDNNISLDYLFNQCKAIFLKYIDQDNHITTLLIADDIWTYFQDLFPVTHYFEGVGNNDVGKSSIAYTFEYTGYRVIRGTAISGPNYYRCLGTDEPGQCVIIEDEGDSISEDPDKIKILKSGYEQNGHVPKINMNTSSQGQQWWKTYCYKMILAEKSLSQTKAMGLIDRTFSGHCRTGKVEYSIKKIVNQIGNKNPTSHKLYNEIIDFRKLMLCYRLMHFKDQLQEIETGLINRDNELCSGLLQLFYGTESLKEIIPCLEFYLEQRRIRKKNSIEKVLYEILKIKLIEKYQKDKLEDFINNDNEVIKSIYYSDIWKYITDGNSIDGTFDPNKPKQFESTSFGTLYRDTLSNKYVDKFGAIRKRDANGIILQFNITELIRLEKIYGDSLDLPKKIEISLNCDKDEKI